MWGTTSEIQKVSGHIRIGIGGWTYAPWRGTFYPEGLVQKRELEYAASKLTSIEIDGTFYGSQKPESFIKWREATPEGFVFSLKAPRYVTHRRELAAAGPTIERFLTGGVLELKEKLGAINWQLKPEMTFEPTDFEAFLKLLPKKAEGHVLWHAVEVRHPSFRVPELVAMARHHGIAVVAAGDSQYPQIPDATAPFVYARIMGTKSNEPLGYSAADLDAWAARARSWARCGHPKDLPAVSPTKPAKAQRDVFLYVISGHKVANPAAAQALIQRLRGTRADAMLSV